MSKLRAYYLNEIRRHSRAELTKTTIPKARQAIRRLCRWANVPDVKVVFSRRRNNSEYNPGGRFIRIDVDMLNWLVIAHEFSHYWHHMSMRLPRFVDTGMPALDQIASKVALKFGWHMTWKKWHNRSHRLRVDSCIRYIKRWKNSPLRRKR